MQMQKQKILSGLLLGILSSCTFGLIPFFSISFNGGMGVPSVLFYRFAFSTIIMLPVFLFHRKRLRFTPRNLGVLLVLGIFYATTSLCLMKSYSETPGGVNTAIPSGIATTIHFLYPILVAGIMMVFFKEKKSVLVIFTALLSIAGVVLMVRIDGITLGVYFACITIVTYALYMVGVKEGFKESELEEIEEAGVKAIVEKSKSKEIDYVIAFFVLLFGAIFFGLYAVFTTKIEPINTYLELRNLIILALFCTVISDCALIIAINKIGPTKAAILGVMEPVVTILVGRAYLSENIKPLGYVGLFLALSSVVIVMVIRADRET
jgi:drug/metabolite transporter (DMT)-like permease